MIAEPTVRSAEVSKLHARCAGRKIAANNMTDVEEEILLQANLLLKVHLTPRIFFFAKKILHALVIIYSKKFFILSNP